MTTQAGTRPSAARGLGLIVRRELGVYFGSRGGWLIAAILLLVMGLLFNADAVGTGSKYSADVLADFFKDASGVMMVGAILVSMRLLAEERQAGTLPLLLNSSLTEGEIVLAKFLSAWLFLSVIMTVGAYMPLLIFVRGKVSLGHLGAGYLGLYLLGAASVAIGTFGSAVARSQVVAAMIGAAILVVLLLVVGVVLLQTTDVVAEVLVLLNKFRHKRDDLIEPLINLLVRASCRRFCLPHASLDAGGG